MDLLNIYLFGSVELFVGNRQLSGFPTKKSRGLFTYLVLRRGKITPRDVVAGEFWGDLPDSRARKALNTDIWRVGQTLRKGGVKPERYLKSDSEGVGFRMNSAHWLDVATFDSLIAKSAKTIPEEADDSIIKALSEAVALYRGDLLVGIYDDWCLVRREALKARYLSALEFLIYAHMARKSWEIALRYSQKALAFDPLQEHIHRVVMRCHYLSGNRPAAVKHYAACAQLLRQELGVEPMEETTRIYETMLSVTPRAPQAEYARAESSLRRPSLSRKTPLQEVSLAIANIETARGWLIDASVQMRNPSGSTSKS
jgi:DNA-binding SARP family transcriptional activator